MDGMVSAITVASMPTTHMPMRITQMISISEAFWRNIKRYTFRANIEAADRTDESADDFLDDTRIAVSFFIAGEQWLR